MTSVARPLTALCLALGCSALHAQPGAMSELQALADAVGPADRRQALAGISARADANGPRGSFTSAMVSLADGTARFRLEMQASTTDLLMAAGKPYVRSATGELQAADAAMAAFLRGHEVHRMLLDLEHRFRPLPPSPGRPEDARAARAPQSGCLPLQSPEGLAVTICRAADAAADLPRSIELELPAALGGGSTTIELGDWRSLHGVRLPFAADFLHAGERHTYRYTDVLPFRLAPGGALPSGADAPEQLFARLGDLADFVSAHERTLMAHRQSDVGLLLGDVAGRSTVSGRGTLAETSRDELAARLGPYLAQIQFTRYEDVVVPVVAVSADGTLGWLACQIEAAGTRGRSAGSLDAGGPPATGAASEASEAIAYGFSWVELYALSSGDWQAIGNVSSPRP